MEHTRKKLLDKITLLAVAMLIWGIGVGLLAGCSKKEEIPDTTVSEEVETTAVVTEATEAVIEVTKPVEIIEHVDGRIHTPYVTLHYPEAFADHLIVVEADKEPYVLAFYAAIEDKTEIRLFDIAFGKGAAGNMGDVKTDTGEMIPIDVVIYTLNFDETWTEGEIITAYAMQDVVNEIIEDLGVKKSGNDKSTPIVSAVPAGEETVNYMEIVTPYTTMYYPARWSSTIRTEHIEDQENGVYKVLFYGQPEGQEQQQIFAVYFGGDEGEQIGAVMGPDKVPVPVNILIVELNLQGWSDEDVQLMYSMQEAFNQLIETLSLL